MRIIKLLHNVDVKNFWKSIFFKTNFLNKNNNVFFIDLKVCRHFIIGSKAPKEHWVYFQCDGNIHLKGTSENICQPRSDAWYPRLRVMLIYSMNKLTNDSNKDINPRAGWRMALSFQGGFQNLVSFWLGTKTSTSKFSVKYIHLSPPSPTGSPSLPGRLP